MYIIPIKKRIILPIILDILPYFMFKEFPKFKPKNVNVALVIANIMEDNI